MTDKPKHKPKPEQTLMDAIGFTEEDLKANREGRLSQRQITQFIVQHRKWKALTLFCVGLCVISFAFAAFVSKRHLEFSGMIFLLTGGIGAYAAWKFVETNKDWSEARAFQINGRMKLDFMNLGSHARSYTLVIEDFHFAVNKGVFLAFKNGDPYIIYYLDDPQTILSAEWLRDDYLPEKG